jgi:hypothetical protein
MSDAKICPVCSGSGNVPLIGGLGAAVTLLWVLR